MKIKLDQVRFDYGDMQMFFDVEIPENRITAIVGPSGAGKSTLLNLIAGFEQAVSGQIIADNKNITNLAPSERPVSMVFQENNLFAHLDVETNISLGRSPKLKLNAKDRTDIQQAIVRVGLAGKEQRKPAELSGGERQRVAIARALIREKPALLLDEAFASLGPALRFQMLDLVQQLQKETKMSVLMVTHTPEDAVYLDSWLLFLENGSISSYGQAKELLSNRGPEALKNYIGQMKQEPDGDLMN